ncbi:MAG TPA: hypothetical protein PLE19_05520 [Planctomycetota bacterium]|nr:hypothetical protein [Planctomycetota bacterium]HRR80194.1 hypothetical protein [Planctomycetota bacterium]HRT93214.1 hypothetical protein [Planctomycetota bacterium]
MGHVQGTEVRLCARPGETRQIKIVIEKHPDGYVAYPVGIQGVVVGEGDTYEEALRDVQSAIKFHVETFGPGVLEGEEGPVLEAFVAEATV